jgi:uncharacterized protein involved in outer membrane biogenesis
MSFRRLAAVVLSAAGALLAAIVLYLAFGDLSRHKGRIEAFVTERIGRPFAIDGAFKLKVLPSIAVAAERIRLGNADWGSQPQMVEIGRVSTRIGLWSLVRGPVDVQSFEMGDVSVLLEKDADGKGNWALGEARAPEETAAPLGSNATAVPAVIQHASLENLRVVYREPGRPDRTARIEAATIGPGSDGLIAISAKGGLDEFPVAVTGEVGPLDALLSGRNIRMAIQAAVGDLKLDLNGGFGRLDPLAGADLAVKAAHPDIGTMLRKLRLPAIASGALAVDARLKDAGDLTRLDLAAKFGDITVKAEGTLRALGLPGSDLRFEAALADASRLAAVFGVAGVPKGALEASGRITSSRTEIVVDGLSARFAGAKARVDGTLRAARGASSELRFALAAASLARLREGLPEIPLSVNGTYVGNSDKLEVKGVKGRIGESEISARASLAQTGKRRVDIDIVSPRLDLTPFSGKGGAKTKKAQTKEPKREFVFDETPLPLGALKGMDTRLHFASAELILGTGVLRDVESTLLVEGGRLTFESRARGGHEGTLSAAVKLAPVAGSAAALDLTVSARNLRSGFGVVDANDPGAEPATSVEASLATKGASAREMAAGANGKVQVTQGPGKLKNGLVAMFGGDLFGELAGKLNPFAAQDLYTQLDCTVARADIVGGRVSVKPVLVQTEKVTIVASGQIDLGTEALTLDFNTRPRTGIGISAGMFTNPFIELAGTLARPRVGVGAKGATAGAAAAATGGATVLAQGLLDRARGSEDLCKKTLEEAAAKPK